MDIKVNQKEAFEAFKPGAMLAGQNKWADSQPHFLRAFKTDPQQIRYALYLGGAMWEMGRREEAVELWSLAADQNPAIRALQLDPSVDAMTRQVSKVADSQIRITMSALQDEAMARVENPGRMQTAFWPQTHIRPTDYPEGGPRPYMFYAPDMPITPVYGREHVSWTAALEAHTVAVRDEFLALAGLDVKGQPYVPANSGQSSHWDALKGQDRWSSIHLYKDGIPMPAAAHCPATCAALEGLPLVQHRENPIEVFFSVLKPGTHIPAHYGLANSRVTVHLPLIIPDNCAIRVGETTHQWQEGETFLFDDSHDHEAWNKSEQTRVVLIFEAWRPDMTSGEIAAVIASYKARQDWLDARRVPQD